MLTTMTEEDWTIVLQVFVASRSRRGDKGRDDRRFLEALHYFVVHNITWRALPAQFGHWNSIWKRFWRLSRTGTFEAFFECARGDERDRASRSDVRFHRSACPCLGSGRKRMARPVGKWFCDAGTNSLHKRIRPFGYAVGQDGDPRVPVLIKGTASRCHFAP